jgi:transposase
VAPAAAQARGEPGKRRLHVRWVTFLDRRKRDTVANARELAGWCWSRATSNSRNAP